MITFNEELHEYTLDGKKLISVTQLMRKHGLAPDYGAVSPEVLAKKAERGSLIHKEIEDFNKTGEMGFTEEVANYANALKEHKLRCLESEKVVHNDMVAGTLDLILAEDFEPFTIADIKTTSTLHKDAVSWQLSIYGCLGYRDLYEKGMLKGKAFHFLPDGSLKIVDIPLKPLDEVERLMERERNGEAYRQALTIEEGQLAVVEEAQRIIAEADRMKKEAEARMAQVKDAIMKAMTENAIKTFENDFIRITLVDPVTKTAIDTAKLKKDLPEIAEKYAKTTTTKASLRITLKGEKE